MKQRGSCRPFMHQSDWLCPRHKVHVASRKRFARDKETGKMKPAGDYYGCPHYEECGYYVNLNGDRVPVMIEGPDGELVADGFDKRNS